MYAKRLNYYGVPGQFTARALYVARSIEDALAILSNSNPGNSYNLNIAAPKYNRIVNVEVDPLGGIGVHKIPSKFDAPKDIIPNTYPQPYYYYHVYRFLTTECVVGPSSEHRMATLAHYKVPETIADIQTMLGDTSDKNYPIYRDGSGLDAPYVTLTTVVYDFVNMVANVYNTNPRSGGSLQAVSVMVTLQCRINRVKIDNLSLVITRGTTRPRV